MNQFDDIYIAQDGNQIIMSTAKDLIQAKNISTRACSVQCLGQLSDAIIKRVIGAITQLR